MSENQHTATSWKLAYQAEKRRGDRLWRELQEAKAEIALLRQPANVEWMERLRKVTA